MLLNLSPQYSLSFNTWNNIEKFYSENTMMACLNQYTLGPWAQIQNFMNLAHLKWQEKNNYIHLWGENVHLKGTQCKRI